MDRVDQGFIDTRSVFHFAGINGCNHVVPTKTEPATTRPYDAKSADLDAYNFYRILFVLSRGSGIVLGTQQCAFNRTTMVYQSTN